ncbi:Ribose operon repressor [Planctomycetes bacterium Pan216]|uniref:Ribose operon repressor n=1 Tax=Kolteria novifilia TaxID=2527975 RepID=A0A518AZV4_9BACT|nr:Ribose operon repressor [Planctomycetes bacterium Pan216]
MKVTLRDIAEAADVSISTVSRVLKGDPVISTDRASLIRGIATRMNYRGRDGAKSTVALAQQTLCGRSVGLVTLGMDRSLLSLPTVALALNGAEAALSQAGANVLLCHVPDLEQHASSLERQSLDGVVLMGALQGNRIATARSALLDRLRQTATVWIVGKPQDCWGDVVMSDSVAVGTRAAEYLIERGHTRLGFVNPKPDHLQFRQRETGFLAAAARAGVRVERFCEDPPGGWSLPLRPPTDVDAVERLVDQMLRSRVRPTGLLAAADSVATLTYRALAARDLVVGRDISVISANNDTAWIAGLHPRLTTFDVHAERIGRLAVHQLAFRMSDPGAPGEVQLLVEPTLVEGNSVARRT